jgi:hypothetical protein
MGSFTLSQFGFLIFSGATLEQLIFEIGGFEI